jgi:hypothetical protein
VPTLQGWDSVPPATQVTAQALNQQQRLAFARALVVDEGLADFDLGHVWLCVRSYPENARAKCLKERALDENLKSCFG